MSELAVGGTPIAVACRVVKLARQPYYRWLADPVTDAERVQARRANALFDAHRDDPEFGYRFLLDEARDAGQAMADRTAWRICRDNGWWSAFGKKKGGKGRRPGPPVHDDRVMRDFAADAPNQLWLSDITEHKTAWIPVVVATPTEGGETMAGPKYSKKQKEQFFDLIDRGGTVRAAAETARVHPEAAYTWLRNAGLTMQRATPRIYTEAEKAEFFRLLAQRPNVSAVAKELGFPRVTCYAWAHKAKIFTSEARKVNPRREEFLRSSPV